MKSYEKFFSKAEIERIHDYTLKILENVGVKFEHMEALEIFKKHGVEIDGDTVFIKEKLLNRVLNDAKKSFTIKSSKGDLHIGSGVQYNMIPQGNRYRHFENGRINKMTNGDIINFFKLVDTSEVIHTGYLDFLQNNNQKYSKEEKILGQTALLLKHSNKPVISSLSHYPFNLNDKEKQEILRKNIELIRKFEGSQGIHYLGDIEILEPLNLDYDSISRIMILSEMKESILVLPSPSPLMIAPPSMISMIAIANAEILSVYTLIKLISPEIPVVYGSIQNVENLLNTVDSIESMLLGYGTAALADRYSLPFQVGGYAHRARDLDVQAGFEAMMMINAAQDCKGDMTLHNYGCMGSFDIIDFRKFLIDEEISQIVQRIYAGIDCKEEKFCFEIIKNAGPRGNFFKVKTPQMYNEEFYLSKYFDKDDPNRWQKKGSIPINEKAQNEISKRLSEYKKPSIMKEQEVLLESYFCKGFEEII